jgi:hypothetical protein
LRLSKVPNNNDPGFLSTVHLLLALLRLRGYLSQPGKEIPSLSCSSLLMLSERKDETGVTEYIPKPIPFLSPQENWKKKIAHSDDDV